jgi:hypothetical protein
MRWDAGLPQMSVLSIIMTSNSSIKQHGLVATTQSAGSHQLLAYPAPAGL